MAGWCSFSHSSSMAENNLSRFFFFFLFCCDFFWLSVCLPLVCHFLQISPPSVFFFVTPVFFFVLSVVFWVPFPYFFLYICLVSFSCCSIFCLFICLFIVWCLSDLFSLFLPFFINLSFTIVYIPHVSGFFSRFFRLISINYFCVCFLLFSYALLFYLLLS